MTAEDERELVDIMTALVNEVYLPGLREQITREVTAQITIGLHEKVPVEVERRLDQRLLKNQRDLAATLERVVKELTK